MKYTINNRNGRAVSQELLKHIVLLSEWKERIEHELDEQTAQLESLLVEGCTVQGGQFTARLEERNRRNISWRKEFELALGQEAAQKVFESHPVMTTMVPEVGRVGNCEKPAKITIGDSLGNQIEINLEAAV